LAKPWASRSGARPRPRWPRGAAALDSKILSRETTIEGGTIDTEFLGGLLEYLSERIGGTLREYGKQACTLGVHLRYVDHFSAHQTMRLERATNDERELLAAARELFTKLFTRRVAIRHVGISVMNLEMDRRQNELSIPTPTAVVSQPRSRSRARALRLERGVLWQRPRAARALRHQTNRPGALHSVFITINNYQAAIIISKKIYNHDIMASLLGTDGLPIRDSGIWAKEKLHYLEHYLIFSLLECARNGPVSCTTSIFFLGLGVATYVRPGKKLMGLHFIALRFDFAKYFFFEMDPDCHKH